MYELKFQATDDAGWAQAIELIDDSTNGPLAAAASASFALEVKDCGCAVLTATTDDNTIERPTDNVIQWRFTKTQMAGLKPRTTYMVGCTMTDPAAPDEPIQLFVGTLAVIDGGF